MGEWVLLQILLLSPKPMVFGHCCGRGFLLMELPDDESVEFRGFKLYCVPSSPHLCLFSMKIYGVLVGGNIRKIEKKTWFNWLR